MEGNSLADKIIAKQETEDSNKSNNQNKIDFFNYDLPKKDEFGIPTANCLDYVIVRILYIDYNVSGREHLHLREDGRIWEGDHWLSENEKNLYKITRWPYKNFTSSQCHRIWARLREFLPTLSYDKMVIKDNLIWDSKNNDVYFSDEPVLTVN